MSNVVTNTINKIANTVTSTVNNTVNTVKNAVTPAKKLVQLKRVQQLKKAQQKTNKKTVPYIRATDNRVKTFRYNKLNRLWYGYDKNKNCVGAMRPGVNSVVVLKDGNMYHLNTDGTKTRVTNTKVVNGKTYYRMPGGRDKTYYEYGTNARTIPNDAAGGNPRRAFRNANKVDFTNVYSIKGEYVPGRGMNYNLYDKNGNYLDYFSVSLDDLYSDENGNRLPSKVRIRDVEYQFSDRKNYWTPIKFYDSKIERPENRSYISTSGLRYIDSNKAWKHNKTILRAIDDNVNNPRKYRLKYQMVGNTFSAIPIDDPNGPYTYGQYYKYTSPNNGNLALKLGLAEILNGSPFVVYRRKGHNMYYVNPVPNTFNETGTGATYRTPHTQSVQQSTSNKVLTKLQKLVKKTNIPSVPNDTQSITPEDLMIIDRDTNEIDLESILPEETYADPSQMYQQTDTFVVNPKRPL